MDIAIIGSGKMALGLATRYAAAGLTVTIGARNREKAHALVAQAGKGCSVDTIANAVKRAELIVLAVPYAAVDEVLAETGDLNGKTLIDITNPITPDYMSLTIGHTTSAAEEIQKRAPKASVVKAFNTIFAELFQQLHTSNKAQIQVFYAADNFVAGEQVAASIRAIGFEPVYSGKLVNARYIEPLAELNIHFGYALGRGTLIAPAWIKYSE